MSEEQYCPNCQQNVPTILATPQPIGCLIFVLCIIAGVLLMPFGVPLSVSIWGLGLLILLRFYHAEDKCPICNTPKSKLEKARKGSPLQSPENPRAKKIDGKLVDKIERWLAGSGATTTLPTMAGDRTQVSGCISKKLLTVLLDL